LPKLSFQKAYDATFITADPGLSNRQISPVVIRRRREGAEMEDGQRRTANPILGTNSTQRWTVKSI